MSNSSPSLAKRSAEGLTQNTIANLITPSISSLVTGLTVWVLTKVSEINALAAGWKIALIVGVAVVLTFLLNTVPSLLREKRLKAVTDNEPPLVSESTRLVKLREDLDAVTRDRDDAKTNLETCWAEQKRTLKKLDQCNSLSDHWKKEVQKVETHYKEQVRLRDEESAKKGGRIGELEQQLRAVQAEADNLKENISIPKGTFKLKKVRWVSIDGDATGKHRDRDLTEFFEDKFVNDGKLTIPRGLYHKLFHGHDPWAGHQKLLEIDFIYAGNRFFVVLPEGVSITLPFPHGYTQANMS